MKNNGIIYCSSCQLLISFHFQGYLKKVVIVNVNFFIDILMKYNDLIRVKFYHKNILYLRYLSMK